jgi:peptide deformylase
MKLDPIVLKQVCEPVSFDDPKKNLRLAHELLQLMRRERGLGLAANQAGRAVRLFVMCVNDVYRHCFNPEILEVSDELVSLDEGCLSFRGEFCSIVRPQRIKVRYYSAQGTATEAWLDGWESRCFQHELDHLNGITMHERIPQ